MPRYHFGPPVLGDPGTLNEPQARVPLAWQVLELAESQSKLAAQAAAQQKVSGELENRTQKLLSKLRSKLRSATGKNRQKLAGLNRKVRNRDRALVVAAAGALLLFLAQFLFKF